MTSLSRRARFATATAALAAVAMAPALQQLPAVGAAITADRPGSATPQVTTVGDPVPNAGALGDLTSLVDASGKPVVLEPTSTQRAAAAALDSTVVWNDAGTPASVLPRDGVLAPAVAGATPKDAARAFLRAHTDLLGLTATQVDELSVVGGAGQKLAGSTAQAVLFRQRFGSLTPATRSMVTVGVAADGSIAYVSSSLVKAAGTPTSPTLSPLQGWLKAASALGRAVDASVVKTAPAARNGWTELSVPGFAQTQLARTRSLAMPDGTVRPVIEADVIDSEGGSALGYRMLIDAGRGGNAVLFRQNAVENSSDVQTYPSVTSPGVFTYGPGTACSTAQTFTLTDDLTKTIAIIAAAASADDITIKVFGPGDSSLGEFDLLTSPEAATLSAPGGGTFAAGAYTFQVCGFDATAMGGPYTASVVTSDQSSSTGTGTGSTVGEPTWRAFAANPTLDSVSSKDIAPSNSVVECWFAGTPDCTPGEAHENVFSTGPWDTVGGLPTFTTIGNNANTHEAWGSFLTPGGAEQAPYSPTRQYTDTFQDTWNASGCDPTELATPSGVPGEDGTPIPGGNDILPVTTNLFTGHNRIHDFSYALGFTERNYNLQLTNRGQGGMEGDQEIGNVQAGAVTGGAPSYMGRDNANQIALQDGVPGITNQYLFQPIAGAFYSPCADGALDTGIYGHEYTHAISNRMVGGPDDGLISEQGGAMGESWSDLNASEYQFENDYLSDPAVARNPWSLGSYTTGNFAKGIRDYAINDNPLNFSDYGFDTTGPEVHADGEIWNGTQWEVRQALVNTWNAQFPYADKALQDRCATPTSDVTTSQPSASQCPGNRRWLQLIYDAWLLQPGSDSMLIARDTMLAADRMRFGGKNRDVIAAAFARRGMGTDAAGGPDETSVTPSFRSAYGNNSAVTFTSTSAGKVYVGNYEARATPVAATDTADQSPTATFTPGIYRITFVSPTNGFRRLILTVPDDGAPITQAIDDRAVNLASAAAGASVIGATDGSLNADALIDGTEATNWAGVTEGNVDESTPGVSVALAGGAPQTITSAKVSALLRPAPASATDLPLLAGAVDDPDPDSASRFTALRKFALQACTTACDQPNATYTTFFTSADDAFPGDIPRPVAPDQTMRSFTFAPVQASAVRLVALENQCTGQDKYADVSGQYTDPVTQKPALDTDPTNDTDCKTASDRGTIVHAAELQVFGGPVPVDPAQATAGDGSPGSGTAGQGTAALPVTGQPALGAGSAPTGPVKTRTRIRLSGTEQVRGKESTTVTYAVVAPTTSLGKTAGRVDVLLDGKTVRSRNVPVTLDMGRTSSGGTYLVPKSLGYGPHQLKVIFTSAAPTSFTSSASRTATLTVVRG